MEGRTIGLKYSLERELARGGMGAIWVALDSLLQRRVALKLMSPDHPASSSARSRFEREAMAIAKLKSPNVVQIYDYGIDNGAPFIVMELLEGEDLQSRLTRLGRLSIPMVISVVTQTAKALAAAHASGVVHRDIKPANIFLARTDNDETVKVLDFGVAALVAPPPSGDAPVTRAGGVVGTPHYMSPEQVRGSRGVDFRSDLWSLAVVAYRALTGKLPFDSDAFGELLIEICTDPVPPASRLLPELGPDVDRFFERALSRDPARRFESARDMASAFATLASAGGRTRPTRILVVDDEPDVALLMKQRFRQQIRKGVFEFVFALDGKEALDHLRQEPDIEIALTDINMPGMDGLTFLRRAGEVNPLVKIVVVSAYSDMSNIREAMNRGAFDFLVKPIDFKDLELTIDKTVKHAREVRQTARSSEENNILRMFVNTGIVERLLPAIRADEDSANEWIEGTVALVDVHGFIPHAGAEPPDTTLRTLNANFDVIVPEMTSRKGVVDKFIGGAVMAVFRDEGHVVRAIEACLAGRDQLLDLSARAGEGSPYALGIAVGIDSGSMISGSIGSKVVGRLDYTVLGEVVTSTFRLESIAGKNQILVSPSVYAKVIGHFDCEPVGTDDMGRARAYRVIRRLESDSAAPSAETLLMETDDGQHRLAVTTKRAAPRFPNNVA